MIILKAEETQALPRQTATPQYQYAGEGSGLVKAGGQIASVANQALQFTTALSEQYARTDALNSGKRYRDDFANEASKFWDDWDQRTVRAGFTPDTAMAEMEGWFAAQERRLTITHLRDVDNEYKRQALKTAFADVRSEVLTKARQHSRNQYLAIGKETAKTNLDQGMSQALLAESRGDHEGYVIQAQRDLAYIDSLNGTFFNAAEVSRLKTEYAEALETKRAHQLVSTQPETFLKQFSDGKFGRLDPKLGRELVTAAENALARKVEIKDRERKLETESRKQYAITLKNELISKAMADPGAALADALRMENRLALGDDFDNTVSTLRSLADPAKVHDDKTTLRNLSNEVERNPSPATYKNLDRALQNGKLSGSSYTSMTHRLTERIEKLKDRTERERHDRTNLAVSTYQPMLRVTGINDFDQISQGAQQLFEDELRFTIEQNKAADPMIEGRRLMIKYLDYVSDHAETFGEAVVQKYGFKSPAEVAQAYQAGKITRTEADVQIWYFSRQANKPKDSASSTSSNLVKKK